MRKFHGSVICLSVAMGICSSFQSVPMYADSDGSVNLADTVRMQEPDSRFLAVWLRYQKINPDLKAVLVFESGLLSLPVVQYSDNTKYLNTAFDGSRSTSGTPFLDCHDSPDDDAILIYGHYVSADPTAMFSPLAQLETQEGYNASRIFFLITQNEKRTYEVISVFRISVHPSVFDQRKSKFVSQRDFDEWISYPLNHNEIRPSAGVSYGDSLCLLQTCVRENENERLIVMGRRKYR